MNEITITREEFEIKLTKSLSNPENILSRLHSVTDIENDYTKLYLIAAISVLVAKELEKELFGEEE